MARLTMPEQKSFSQRRTIPASCFRGVLRFSVGNPPRKRPVGLYPFLLALSFIGMGMALIQEILSPESTPALVCCAVSCAPCMHVLRGEVPRN